MTTTQPTYGRYEIRGELGWGGFAMVYRAWDTVLHREVALKALLPHLARDPDLRSRFLAEAQALARLQHNNIVPVYDIGEAQGQPFFAMALVDGQTLAEFLAASKTLPLQQVIDIVRSLAAALDELHSHGLVHRDLKPQNVMLDRAGRVVLMDLGIARALDGTGLTQTGATLGTPPYMAPEQVRGERVTPATDIYALGIVTYHLLAGRPPFMGDTAAVLYAQVHEPPPPLKDIRRGLPEPIYAAIDAALAKDPALRPSSAGRFVELMNEPLPVPTAPLRARLPPVRGHGVDVAYPNKPIAVRTPRVQPHLVSPVAQGIEERTTEAFGSGERPGPGVAAGRKWAVSLVSILGVLLLIATVAALVNRPTRAPGARLPRVTTLAGTGVKGHADGSGAIAQFESPYGIGVGPDGNLYVAELGKGRVRRITPEGKVTTLGGLGAVGFADGTVGSAALYSARSVAVDRAGNVYVGDDSEIVRIRKISLRGEVSTLAPPGIGDCPDGTGPIDRWFHSTAIAVDTAGDLYFALGNVDCIGKLTPSGGVTTIAGSLTGGFADGPGRTARFSSPQGLAVDRNGNLYVADAGNNRVRMITPDGNVTTFAGSGANGVADGPGPAAQFSYPSGIAIDESGNLYVAEYDGSRIRKITPDGTVTTIAGSGVRGFFDGPGPTAQFNSPTAIAVDRTGNLCVADLGNNRIRKIAP